MISSFNWISGGQKKKQQAQQRLERSGPSSDQYCLQKTDQKWSKWKDGCQELILIEGKPKEKVDICHIKQQMTTGLTE